MTEMPQVKPKRIRKKPLTKEQLTARKEYNRKYYRKEYAWKRAGLAVTKLDYEIMMAYQNNNCAICGSDSTYFGIAMAVDHCHTTGKIRGLLCTNCNIGLGNFKDSPELLSKAIWYLTEYKNIV